LSPYPAAWCYLTDQAEPLSIKIYEAEIVEEEHSFDSGQLFCTKKEMKVAVKGGFLLIKSLQLPGKKRMKITELLNGVTFSEHAKLQ
jgi:methionyl-tRNA formyltransferase